MTRYKRNWSIAIAGGIVLGLSAIACACNVPVFRFALERWRADSYRTTLFHRGPLSAAERETIQPLNEQLDKGLANLAFRTVDVTAFDASVESRSAEDVEQMATDRELLARLGNLPLPSLVVQYPTHLNIPKPVSAGPLAREAIAGLIDSPVRQELVRRLVDGHTAVWLLLESGEPQKDDDAAALVTSELKVLEQTLELPELTASPDDELTAATPFKLAFSLLRVPRNAAEQSLVAMLIGSEPDLAERSDPMVFPVFGRGRALLPLIGAGITAKNIHDSAEFLAGPCSCQVKEQNPGFDLLLSADWNALLSKSGVPLVSAASATPQFPADAELVPIPPGAASPAPVTAPLAVTRTFRVTTSLTWIVIGIAALASLAIVGLVVAAQLSLHQSPRD